MSVDVKAQWHRLTNADDSSQSPVFVNEAAIAYVRPVAGGRPGFEVGLVSGAKIAVHEDPEDFLGPLTGSRRSQ